MAMKKQQQWSEERLLPSVLIQATAVFFDITKGKDRAGDSFLKPNIDTEHRSKVRALPVELSAAKMP